MATYLSEYITEWLWERENPVLHSAFDAAAMLAVGMGSLAKTLQNRTSIVKTVVTKLIYSIITRGVPIVILLAAQTTVPEDSYTYKSLDGALWIQGALVTLDMTLIGVWVQRDLGERTALACHQELCRVDDAIQQTITRLITPTLVGAMSIAMPMILQIPMQGVALGCQIHDTALASRGMCSTHRLARWSKDGITYMVLGMTVAMVGTQVWWVISGAAVQGICNVLSAAATIQPMQITTPLNNSWVEWPYGLAHQCIERTKRILLSGAFSPSLTQKTPIAVVLLRIYTNFQHIRRYLKILPMGLVQPEIHYMLGELITVHHLEDALSGIRELLAASKSPLKRLSTQRLPVMTAILTGMPKSAVTAVGTVLSDQTSIAAVVDIQRQLARRLSEVRADNPLSFAEWDQLGIRPDAIARWDLNAALTDSAWVNVVPDGHDHWVERGATAFY